MDEPLQPTKKLLWDKIQEVAAAAAAAGGGILSAALHGENAAAVPIANGAPATLVAEILAVDIAAGYSVKPTARIAIDNTAGDIGSILATILATPTGGGTPVLLDNVTLTIDVVGETHNIVMVGTKIALPADQYDFQLFAQASAGARQPTAVVPGPGPKDVAGAQFDVDIVTA